MLVKGDGIRICGIQQTPMQSSIHDIIGVMMTLTVLQRIAKNIASFSVVYGILDTVITILFHPFC